MQTPYLHTSNQQFGFTVHANIVTYFTKRQMTIDFFCTLADSYALHVCEIFWTGTAITTD